MGIGLSSTVSLVLATTFGLVLYRFPPERYTFYPRCPIYEYLHLQCPGCGATRAFSALLHGQLIDAIQDNAFAVLIVLPLAAVYAFLCLNRSRSGEAFRWPSLPTPATIAMIAMAAAFTLVRNL